jgi:hypothetical protein
MNFTNSNNDSNTNSDDIDPADVPVKDAAFYARLRGGAGSGSALESPKSGVDYSEIEDEPTDEHGDLIEYYDVESTE